MLLFYTILTFLYPHLIPEIGIDSQGVYFTIHAPDSSTDFAVYLSEIKFYPQNIIPTYYYEYELWDREKRKDTVFTFHENKKRYPIQRNVLYEYRVRAFNIKQGNMLVSQPYYFRLNRKGKIGIYPTLLPVMQLLHEDTIGIFFETNQPVYAKLILKFKGKENEVIYHNRKSERHEFRIPFKKGWYAYRFVLYNDEDTFISRSIPVKYRGKIEKIAIFGDTRANWHIPSANGRTDGVNEDIVRQIVRAIYMHEPDLVVVNGDLITGYTPSMEDALLQYQAFLKSLQPITSSIPFLFVPGNHDMTTPLEKEDKGYHDPKPPESAENLWQEIFMQPENGPDAGKGKPPYKENVYLIALGKRAIFFLNSDYNYAKQGRKRVSGNLTWQQLEWVKKNARNFKELIIVFHEPLYANTSLKGHALDYDPALRDSFVNFFSQLPVKLIITSHEHLYARRWIKAFGFKKQPIYQITVGVGGAPLYKVSEVEKKNLLSYSKQTTFLLLNLKRKKGKVYNLLGFIIDEFNY